MTFFDKAEHRTRAVFRHFPQLNTHSKHAVVRAWPWLALFTAGLQLVAAWALWRLLNAVTSVSSLSATVARYYQGQLDGPTSLERILIYAGLVLLIGSALMMVAAIEGLSSRRRSGWRLVSFATTLNVIYAGLQLWITGRGLGSCLFSLAESLAIFYGLFQVYDMYHPTHKA